MIGCVTLVTVQVGGATPPYEVIELSSYEIDECPSGDECAHRDCNKVCLLKKSINRLITSRIRTAVFLAANLLYFPQSLSCSVIDFFFREDACRLRWRHVIAMVLKSRDRTVDTVSPVFVAGYCSPLFTSHLLFEPFNSNFSEKSASYFNI